MAVPTSPVPLLTDATYYEPSTGFIWIYTGSIYGWFCITNTGGGSDLPIYIIPAGTNIPANIVMSPTYTSAGANPIIIFLIKTPGDGTGNKLTQFEDITYNSNYSDDTFTTLVSIDVYGHPNSTTGANTFNEDTYVVIKGATSGSGSGGTTPPSVTPPSGTLSAATPYIEIGGSTDYTLNWSVTKNSLPITGITVDGNVITPTGSNQSGNVTGNVSSPNGNFTKTMNINDGTSPQVTVNANIFYLYRLFFGATATVPAVSADVRSLTNSQLTNAGNSFTLNTGTVYKIFALAIPSSMSLLSVVDQDAFNLDVTSLYIASTITVNDIGGTAHAYKLYVMQNSIPYSSNHRHLITVQ